jgi:hypothetical protein
MFTVTDGTLKYRVRIDKRPRHKNIYKKVTVFIEKFDGRRHFTDEDGKEYDKNVYHTVAVGEAKVFKTDRVKGVFDKFIGYRKALSRALDIMYPENGREARNLFWEAYRTKIENQIENK